MKKIMMASVLLMGTNILADDYIRPFVGLSLASSQLDIRDSARYCGDGSDYTMDYCESIDIHDNSIGINIGATIDNTQRLYISYNNYEVDYGSKVNLIEFNYDHYFNNYINEYKFVPFIGANVGKAQINNGYITGHGNSYGLQVGILKQINQSIDVDFSAAHSIVNINGTYQAPASIGWIPKKTPYEFNYLNRLKVQFNYKF